MSEVYNYDGTHVTKVRDQTVELSESADGGNPASSTLVIEDPSGNTTITGHKSFRVTQSSCSVVNVFRGFVTDREYARADAERTQTARHITLHLIDLNAKLGFKVIRGGAWRKRPNNETIGERLTDMLAADFMDGIHDNGFVNYPDVTLDGGDLRGQFPGDVIGEMAELVGYNWFIYWDESATAASLWFQDSNASTDWSSTLRISDVASEVDGTTTFAPAFDTKLTRSPARVVSGVWLPYKKGNVYRTRAATEDDYEPRDGTAPSAGVKRRFRARNRADKYLFTHRNEEDTITTVMRQVPDTKVNLARAGQRISCKFTSFDNEGYGSFKWFRIMERTVRPLVAEGAIYDIDMILSPQEANDCSVLPTFVQHRYVDGDGSYVAPNWTDTFSFTGATGLGNLVVVATFTPKGTGPGDMLDAPPGWNWAIQNQDTDDSGVSTRCNVLWKVSQGESSIALQFESSGGGTAPRYVMAEYAGLANPTLFDFDQNRQDPGAGSATTPTVSYPAGPAAIVWIGFMEDGPTGGDSLSMDAGPTLRTAISGGLHGTAEVAIGDTLRDGSSGSTSTRFLFTGSQPTLTVGLVFQGDNC